MNDRNSIIRIDNLTKSYGKRRGVIDLSLEVCKGEVFGFLGPNGAGKTTTIRTMLDFIRPTRGRIELFGLDAQARTAEIHRRIGYLPGELALYDNLNGRDMLAYFGHLRGGVDMGYARSLAERLDLDLSRRIRVLSKGNKQKIGLVQAFMHRPELLVLDEPTSGLDPLVQQEFNRLVREVRDEGTTVFLSSHILAEVERIAGRVAIIREGRLLVVEEIRALKAKALRRIELEFARPVPQQAFAGLTGVREIRVEDNLVQVAVEGAVDPLIKVAAHYEVIGIKSQEPDLEEIFLEYFSGMRGGELNAA